MRLRHALPAGLLDAGYASLARLIVGIYPARALTVSDLGAYALFFSAFVFASVMPMQFVLVPAELATLPAARRERLALVRQSWRIGIPMAAATAVVASGAAALSAERRPGCSGHWRSPLFAAWKPRPSGRGGNAAPSLRCRR
jgi:hypothetical protein